MGDFQPYHIPLGVNGLDLYSEVDRIPADRCARFTNAVRLTDGGITARPGQTSFATAGTNIHSILRLNNPLAGTFTRVWGIDGNLYYGATGALTLAEAGFSGDPLALVPYRPSLSGATWAYVGDRTKMRKIRDDGLDLAIGLPVPAVDTIALAAELTTAIEQFEAGFNPQTVAPGGASVPSYVAGKVVNALNILTAVGTATAGYTSFVDKAFAGTIDCSLVGGVASTDDDFIHLWLKVDQPTRVAEIKLYLVASLFTANTIPGTSTAVNTDAYMKAFRPSDYTTVVEQTQSAITGTDRAVGRRQIEDAADRDSGDQVERGTGPNTRNAQRDPGGITGGQLVAGRGQWTEFGIVNVALRKGDFLRIGSDETRGWATLTGITIVIQTNTNTVVNVTIDDLYLRGGRGLDSSDPAAQPYDVRTTHYDPRTGAESNGCPIQDNASAGQIFLDSLRRGLTATPAAAFGDAAMRQRFYIRGGLLLTDDWYFAGVNAADGGAFTITQSEETLVASGTIPTDHFQPVPTVDANGATVLAQAVPCLWGPVQNFLFACGDPYRPGHLYFGTGDHWSASGNVEVCSPSEQLMNGCVFGGESYVFSRKALYVAHANLSGDGGMTAIPTACKKGLAARWGLVAGTDAIYFVGVDGLYRTTGGEPQNISDERVRGLFHGETRHGYLPVDFTVAVALRLEIFDNELWFVYQDTGGTRRTLVYSLIFKYWRPYSFAKQLSALYAEDGAGVSTLLMGGRTTGAAYTHTGFSDDGTAIAGTVRTGALDQGNPYADKLYDEIAFDLDRGGVDVSLTPYVNNEATTLATTVFNFNAGRSRYYYRFATPPQRGRNLSVEYTWSSTSARPVLYFALPKFVVEPGQALIGAIDWENLGDTYYTGIDLEVDTFGLAKTVLTQVDGVTVGTFTVTQTGRGLVHLTLTPGRGHVYRFLATDSNPWIVYSHKWYVAEEPPEQSNWNQNYTLEGTLGDKWIKGVLLAVDTNGLDKTVQLQGDGVVQATITVNGTQASRAKQYSFAQFQARTLRLIPTDALPGRLYGEPQWLFDQEPLALSRWETQETNHGIPGDQLVLAFHLTLRSTATVTLTLTIFNEAGVLVATQVYSILTTGNTKQMRYVPCTAAKGVLFKYVLTSAVAFYLYREESGVDVAPWGSDPRLAHPFGNDDLDATRGMTNASLAAARPGGRL